MTNDEIDYSDIPPLTEEFFKNASLRISVNQVFNLEQLRSDIKYCSKGQDLDWQHLRES